MKKIKMSMAVGAVLLVLSACGQAEKPSPEETQADVTGGAVEVSDGTEKMRGTQDVEYADSDEGNPTGSKEEGHLVTDKDDVLESLTGEYSYSSDYGTGRLSIQKTSNGYDISDYESEDSYRFLADSSNIEAVEDGRIYIKYPEQAFSDGEAVFGYYILEYNTDGIDVYNGKSSFERAEFLYHATKETEASANQQENSAEDVETTESEMTAEELLDLFINGEICAVDSTDSTFYITDLNMDSGEWDSYSIGEKVDLDNDGENELVISGPYGGMYLDARDNKVYEFAVAEGTALVLSYTYYNGAVWIMYSNRSSAGFEFYHMEKFEGADNLVAEMNLGEELADPDHAEAGLKYTLNGTEISYEEYSELCSKIFAAEVNTN